ncbi:ACR family protein [Lysobacteraceae bacterium NML93-0399]|nr:ACR family protein [Xanthomonadaceae bacterium NML93-0399]
MRAFRLLLLSLVATFLLPACASGGDWVELAGHRYQVEVAATDEARARGLMFRDTLADGHGMLFIHDNEAPQAYWMKNTRIALDILYFDEARTLVSQQRDVPPCSGGNRCPSYPSDAPARYVLELNAGEARRIGLKDGETLTFSPSIAVP